MHTSNSYLEVQSQAAMLTGADHLFAKQDPDRLEYRGTDTCPEKLVDYIEDTEITYHSSMFNVVGAIGP